MQNYGWSTEKETYDNMKKRLLTLLILITIASLLFTACGAAAPVNTSATSVSSAATAFPSTAEAADPEAPVKSPVTIAVIDTGFSPAAIPQESIVPGKNYLDETLSTDDTYGHGTAIASVILAHNPDVLLVPLVSNAYEDGKIIQVDNDVLAQMIVDAVDVYRADIVNISAGLILDKESIRNAIEYAEQKDVLVVASVGNDYADYGVSKYYPAAYDTVLAVGSLNPEETEISAFSQRGEWVDIYTCGEEVTIGTLSGNTRTSNGTSYSAAAIAAYAARLISTADADLSVAGLRQMIEDSAKVLSDGTKYIPQEKNDD